DQGDRCPRLDLLPTRQGRCVDQGRLGHVLRRLDGRAPLTVVLHARPAARFLGPRLMMRSCMILIGLAASTCGRGGPEVVAYTSVDQVFSEPVFRECERQAGLAVRAVFDTEETKSTGHVNRLIAEAASPQADVCWSGWPV